MAKNKGFRVPDTVVTNDSRDIYPVARANDIEGGYHIQDNENDMYTQIPGPRRKIGMIVYCSSSEKWYKLKSHNPKSKTTNNTNWVEVFKATPDIAINISKQVVFCFPKINSNTIEPEILIPFEGKILSVDANISIEDNPDIANETDPIELGFKHRKHTAKSFSLINNVTIPAGQTGVHVDINPVVLVEDEFLKITLESYPAGIKNLNVVVNMTTEVKSV